MTRFVHFKESEDGRSYEVLPADVVEKHFCKQCGEDLGYEWLLGDVCGKCCRANHYKVTHPGKTVKKGKKGK